MAVLLALSVAVRAEEPPTRVVRGATEWSASASVARGISFLQSNGGERYGLAQLSWGRVLTDPIGRGVWRGHFEWVVEALPVMAEWSGGRARGVGLSPLGWRWNFAPRGRLSSFGEVGGGALWTSQAIPRGTTSTNFTAYAGIGLRVFGRGRGGMVVSYRLHHISNGNSVRRNPGVNAHMVSVGWTHLGGPR